MPATAFPSPSWSLGQCMAWLEDRNIAGVSDADVAGLFTRTISRPASTRLGTRTGRTPRTAGG